MSDDTEQCPLCDSVVASTDMETYSLSRNHTSVCPDCYSELKPYPARPSEERGVCLTDGCDMDTGWLPKGGAGADGGASYAVALHASDTDHETETFER
jgi:hypothetical protein